MEVACCRTSARSCTAPTPVRPRLWTRPSRWIACCAPPRPRRRHGQDPDHTHPPRSHRRRGRDGPAAARPPTCTPTRPITCAARPAHLLVADRQDVAIGNRACGPGDLRAHHGGHLLPGRRLRRHRRRLSCAAVAHGFPRGSAASLWASLQRLLALPEEIRVYPGHNYGPTPTSTLSSEVWRTPIALPHIRGVCQLRERPRKG